MKLGYLYSTTLVALFAIASAPASPMSPKSNQVQGQSLGTVVAYPWAFTNGTETARKSVSRIVGEISKKAMYEVVPNDVAFSEWSRADYRLPTSSESAKKPTLQAFGTTVHATFVIYGSVAWHTRSIWVNVGPKTVSTATVSLTIMDVATGNTVYEKLGIAGRSDEKSNALKVAGDLLITPLVSAVSGGPASPQEERAAQIAISKAMVDWVRPVKTK
jgi:hypothetical protein